MSQPDAVERLSQVCEEYRPHVMWFWNAPLDEEEVRRQVRGFREAGLGAFYIHPLYGFPVDYLSDAMFRAIGWAVDEARRQGLRYWIYDEYNWPSGAAGGYVIRDHPERRSLILVRREWAAGEAQPDLPGPLVAQWNESDGRTVAYCETAQNGRCPFALWAPFCWGQEGYADLTDPQATRAFRDLTPGSATSAPGSATSAPGSATSAPKWAARLPASSPMNPPIAWPGPTAPATRHCRGGTASVRRSRRATATTSPITCAT
jgi:hypothetical protein